MDCIIEMQKNDVLDTLETYEKINFKYPTVLAKSVNEMIRTETQREVLLNVVDSFLFYAEKVESGYYEEKELRKFFKMFQESFKIVKNYKVEDDE